MCPISKTVVSLHRPSKQMLNMILDEITETPLVIIKKKDPSDMINM